MDSIYNIIPQFRKAIEKMALKQGSGDEDATADDIYEQHNMWSANQVKHIEYLCMRLLELKDKKQQQNVLLHYIALERNLRSGFWKQDDKDVPPEKLLEMAFDEANVKYLLANRGNLSDKKRTAKPRNRTVKQKQTAFQRAITWLKRDIQKFFD